MKNFEGRCGPKMKLFTVSFDKKVKMNLVGIGRGVSAPWLKCGASIRSLLREWWDCRRYGCGKNCAYKPDGEAAIESRRKARTGAIRGDVIAKYKVLSRPSTP